MGDVGAATPRADLRDPAAMRRWAAGRATYLDNLKTLVIAGVIVMHGCVGYVATADEGWWPYASVHEVTLSPAATAVLFAVVGPVALFMMALLFMVSGLFTGPSLRRKGPGRFARDRLLRLGLPYVAVALVLWPLLLFWLYRRYGAGSPSFWAEYVRHFPDPGPLWFVGALLLFSLGYALVCAVRPPSPESSAWLISDGGLVLLALAIAGATFLIRLRYSYGSRTLLYLNEWQWPECVGLFAVGIAASRRGWTTRVPADLARRSRRFMALAVAGAVVLACFVGVLGVDVEEFIGGWHWPALALAVVEGLLTVFGSVWLLAVAQRHLDVRLPLGPQLARGAYGAFIVQGFVLIGLAVLLRPLPMVAELKALVVALGGVAGSFAVGWLLVTRIPVLSRFL